MMTEAQKRYQAIKHMPNVVQFHEGKYDDIQPVYFGDFIPGLPPTVYYEIREYKSYFIIVYCFYHRKDWSNSKIRLIKKLDSHECDFEGIVVCVDSNTGNVLWCCTRYHFELKFVDHALDYIHIESQGHGIKPGYPKKLTKFYKVYQKDCFSFRTMGSDRFKKVVYPVFEKNNVTSWMTWNDYKIEDDHGIKRTRGLIEKNPAKLFEFARKSNKVRSLK